MADRRSDEFKLDAVRNALTEVLHRLFLRHGGPEVVRSDIGPELASEATQGWLEKVGVKLIRIYPGSPWENGYNERFKGTFCRTVRLSETPSIISVWRGKVYSMTNDQREIRRKLRILQLGDAVLAAKPLKHDADLLLSRILFAGASANVLHDFLGWGPLCSRFLFYLYSFVVTMSQKPSLP